MFDVWVCIRRYGGTLHCIDKFLSVRRSVNELHFVWVLGRSTERRKRIIAWGLFNVASEHFVMWY